MEERYVYIPKQYFYVILIIFLVISVGILLDFYLIGIKAYDIVFISVMISIFVAVLIFSYLSYIGRIPYLVEYGGNLYASKYQLILSIIIFSLLFLLIPYIYLYEKTAEALVSTFLIIAIGVLVIALTYLSYKKKIPLLRLKF